MEEKKTALKDAASNFVELHDSVKYLLTDTYSLQRLFINNPDPPCIQDIKREWPILLQEDVIYWHYETLMGHSIHTFSTIFQTKVEKILKFGINKKYMLDIPSLSREKELKCFEIIGLFFNEHNQQLICDLSVNVSINFVVTSPTFCILTLYCIKFRTS